MNKKELLIKIYRSLAKKLKREPSSTDLIAIGINRGTIRHYFGNMSNLKKSAGNISGIKKVKTELEEIYKALEMK